jgi:hypothetical protein
MPKRRRLLTETQLVELVETHNLVSCLNRLIHPWKSDRWKRALYHALLISGVADQADAEKIRQTLGLP